jgi:hypothetical protein
MRSFPAIGDCIGSKLMAEGDPGNPVTTSPSTEGGACRPWDAGGMDMICNDEGFRYRLSAGRHRSRYGRNPRAFDYRRIVTSVGNRRSLVRKRTGPKSGLTRAHQLA